MFTWPQCLKNKLKPDKCFITSHLRTMWCHQSMVPHSFTCSPTLWAQPALTPASKAGTLFTYLRRMEGWVDLDALITTGQESNPWPLDRESDALTVVPPRHPLLSCSRYVGAETGLHPWWWSLRHWRVCMCAQHIENNWRTGQHLLQRIHCHSETSKGVYCLQYDDCKIVSGLRDNTIKVSRFSK